MINRKKLQECEKQLVEVINTRKIKNICKYFSSCSTGYLNLIFKNLLFVEKFKKTYIFEDDQYFNYLRGLHNLYIKNYIKAKNLMKKYYQLNIMINNIGIVYENLKKYNKSIYYHKKCQYFLKVDINCYSNKFRILSKLYLKKKINKSRYSILYHHLKNASDVFRYNMSNMKIDKSYIFIIMK